MSKPVAACLALLPAALLPLVVVAALAAPPELLVTASLDSIVGLPGKSLGLLLGHALAAGSLSPWLALPPAVALLALLAALVRQAQVGGNS